MALSKITADSLQANVVASAIGYVPANAAGDNFTGQVKVSGPMANIGPTSKGVYIGYDPNAANNVGIEIVSGPVGISWVDFGNGDGSDFRGRIGYDSNTNALFLCTNTLNRLNIDSTGRMTVPNQPMFSGIRNTTPTTLASGNVVLHNVTVTDVGGYYSAATGRFTCPVAGRYMVTIGGHAENSQPTSHQIRKNGTTVAYEYGSMPSGSYVAMSRTIILTCAANDYIDHYISTGTFWCGDGSGLTMTVMLVS